MDVSGAYLYKRFLNTCSYLTVDGTAGVIHVISAMSIITVCIVGMSVALYVSYNAGTLFIAFAVARSFVCLWLMACNAY